MSGPTVAQIDTLLNFLEEHRGLAQGNLRSIEGRVQSRRLWEDVCTTLNSMGGCIKTTKQWQKVWTDKKHMAKKALAAVRRSASATGGGPSTAPSLSQWELKIVSIMGDGFGEPQTSARSQAFVEHPSQETFTAAAASTDTPSRQERDYSLPSETQTQEPSQQESSQQPSVPINNASTTRYQLTSTRQRRESRRRTALRSESSVRERVFRADEVRLVLEEQRNVELAGIRIAIVELCGHMQQIKELLQNRI